MSESAIAKLDPVWEQLFSRREWGKYPPEHVVRFVARSFYKALCRREVRLLEIGCGPGANVWFMAREGFTVSGIDGSPTAVRLANQRLAKEGLAADLRVGDFATLPWPDASFDGVLENVSLYCNSRDNIVSALREVRRVLKPQAPFQASFFSDRTWGYGLGTEVEPNGFENISEGPLVGTGFCFFVDRTLIDELFDEFTNVSAERISWTMESERNLIEQFVVTCRNPGV